MAQLAACSGGHIDGQPVKFRCSFRIKPIAHFLELIFRSQAARRQEYGREPSRLAAWSCPHTLQRFLWLTLQHASSLFCRMLSLRDRVKTLRHSRYMSWSRATIFADTDARSDPGSSKLWHSGLGVYGTQRPLSALKRRFRGIQVSFLVEGL